MKELDINLYFAYGSNMDEEQMTYRCPGATEVGICTLEDMQFVLDSAGVASIVPKTGSSVTGVVWRVSNRNIVALDRYEGVSLGCYRKEFIQVSVNGQKRDALVYLSNRDTANAGWKSGYMDRIVKAAKRHRFSQDYINELQSWNK